MSTIENMMMRNQELLLEIHEDIKTLIEKNQDSGDAMMTGTEAAAILGVGYVHFMNFWKHKFPHEKVGRNVLFDRAAVLAFVRSREQAQAPIEHRQSAAV